MRDAARWLIVVGLALVAIGLVAYARGSDHHRGDDVGAMPAVAAARA
jgi:multisubunit Na+/H+ antiporter MnhC subunit